MKRAAFIFLLAIIFFVSCDDTVDTPEQALTVEDYTGNWFVEETCSKNSYTVSITEVPGDTVSVYIYNFAQMGENTKALASIDDDLITVLSQEIDGTTVHGTGTYSDGKITWSYEINDGADLFKCTAIYKK